MPNNKNHPPLNRKGSSVNSLPNLSDQNNPNRKTKGGRRTRARKHKIYHRRQTCKK